MIFLFVKGSIKKICYADNFSNENKAYRSVAVEVKVNVNDISAGDEFIIYTFNDNNFKDNKIVDEKEFVRMVYYTCKTICFINDKAYIVGERDTRNPVLEKKEEL